MFPKPQVFWATWTPCPLNSFAVIRHLSCFYFFSVTNTTVMNFFVHKQAQISYDKKCLHILNFVKREPEIGLDKAQCDWGSCFAEEVQPSAGRGAGALGSGTGPFASCYVHLCICEHPSRVFSAFGNWRNKNEEASVLPSKHRVWGKSRGRN